MELLSIRAGVAQDYNLCFDQGFAALYPQLKALGKHRAFCIISDENVYPLYGQALLEGLEEAYGGPEAGIRTAVYCLAPGEASKTLETAGAICRFLLERGFDRQCLLLALGGGVVGDLTGFVASIFLRGVDFVQLPTSLLAQNDSSIGGKTGVDLDGYKNVVGAFKMPRLVYANLSALATLPEREFSSGMAEVLKHGLLGDEDFYVWLLEHMVEILDRDMSTLQAMNGRSCRIKQRIVEADPLEKGERRLLNFGHTLGHAIEKAKGFALTHGECVSLGMVAAAYISWQRGYIEMEEFYEIRDMMVFFGLPITMDGLDVAKIIALTKSDKKMEVGRIRFVLLEAVGRAFVAEDVEDGELEQALAQLVYKEEA